MNTEDDLFEALAKQQYGATKRKGGETEGPSRRRHAFMAMARPFLRVVVVVTTPHTDANSIHLRIIMIIKIRGSGGGLGGRKGTQGRFNLRFKVR